MKQNIKLTFNLTEKGYNQLQDCVKQFELSQSDIIRMALREYWNKYINKEKDVNDLDIRMWKFDHTATATNKPFTSEQENWIREIIEETIRNIIK